MKKNICFLLLFFSTFFRTFFTQAQILNTNTAFVKFDAAKTSIEPIKAENKNVKLILNGETGEMACLIQIAQFSFPNKLMQEHFNENYMETEKYPKATLSATIQNFNDIDFSKEREVILKGEFNIHGKTKTKSIPLKIKKEKNTYTVKGQFNIQLKEFNIKIPTVMFYKIAEEVEVNINAELKKK